MEQDIEFLVGHLEKNAFQGVRKVLDVGCGTGRYLVPLANRGFRMTGLDNSPDMLKQCREKLNKSKLKADLAELDMMDLDADQEYDALLCMNSVICYLLKTEEILKVLNIFKKALRDDGILVLEIWNIFANTHLFGQTSTRSIQDDHVTITIEEFHRFESFCSVLHTKLNIAVQENEQAKTFIREEVLRAMTAGEVIAYLKAAGFGKIDVFPRSDGLENSPDDEELIFFATR